jgi:hypothetical protein
VYVSYALFIFLLTSDSKINKNGTAIDGIRAGGKSRCADQLGFTPLVLFSCSAVRTDALHAQEHSWKYIQGAGDDDENWCQGLTSELFWRHREEILHSDDPVEVTIHNTRLLICIILSTGII